jgi:hypothetical protein
MANGLSKASRQWKKFCNKKGQKGSLNLESSPDALLKEYGHRTWQVDIVEKAIESVMNWDWQLEDSTDNDGGGKHCPCFLVPNIRFLNETGSENS